MNKPNQKVLDILEEMRRQLTLTALKGLGLTILSVPVIVLGCLWFGIFESAAPSVIGVFTVFYISFTYTGPRYKEIIKEYRALAHAELEKIKNEDPINSESD